MEKINCSIHINAPVVKVWDTMLDDVTYREWTSVFAEGSHYKGSWSEGSEIHFLAPSDTGEMGMVSRIKENRPYEFLSIEHIGIIKDGEIDTTSDEAKQWTPSLENYTFQAVDEGTDVSIEMDIEEEYKDMFNDLWPKALQKLKEIAEK